MDMKRGTLINGLKVMVNPESDDAPRRKIAEQRDASNLSQFVDSRQDHCWLCDRNPTVWVREVVFDLGENEHDPIRKTALAVDSRHYPGPVPGFCYFHLASGPGLLAETVYNGHEVVAWGFRPSRWFVMFTDGTMARGNAIEIDANPQRAPITNDTHKRGNDG